LFDHDHVGLHPNTGFLEFLVIFMILFCPRQILPFYHWSFTKMMWSYCQSLFMSQTGVEVYSPATPFQNVYVFQCCKHMLCTKILLHWFDDQYFPLCPEAQSATYISWSSTFSSFILRNSIFAFECPPSFMSWQPMWWTHAAFLLP